MLLSDLLTQSVVGEMSEAPVVTLEALESKVWLREHGGRWNVKIMQAREAEEATAKQQLLDTTCEGIHELPAAEVTCTSPSPKGSLSLSSWEGEES